MRQGIAEHACGLLFRVDLELSHEALKILRQAQVSPDLQVPGNGRPAGPRWAQVGQQVQGCAPDQDVCLACVIRFYAHAVILNEQADRGLCGIEQFYLNYLA